MARLGFDIDEVISNTYEWIVWYLKDTYNFKLDYTMQTDYDFTKHPKYYRNKKAFKDVFERFKVLDYLDDVVPNERGVQVLRNLFRKGHKIHFISARPEGLEHRTKRWFVNNGIPFHSVHHVGRGNTKGPTVKRLKLDFYIDDNSKDLSSILNYKKNWKKGIFIFDKPWNVSYSSKYVDRLYTWDDILKRIHMPRQG